MRSRARTRTLSRYAFCPSDVGEIHSLRVVTTATAKLGGVRSGGREGKMEGTE
jgi:hypothetical protein